MADGTIYRFDGDGTNSGYYALYILGQGEKKILYGIVGDWKRGESWRVKTKGDLTKEEMALVDKQIEEMRTHAQESKRKHWEEVALRSAAEFETFTPDGTTPYLRRKGIGQLFGTRIRPNENHDPILVVPLRDVTGRLWNYQRIYATKLSAGDKFFQGGGRIEGCFHLLDAGETGKQERTPEILSAKEIFVAEGFATAASIFLAIGYDSLVVCAFNAGNLRSVCEEIRRVNKDCRIIVCADHDAYTTVKGKPYNVGLEKATQAAAVVKGEVRSPRFREPRKDRTDFNDLLMECGSEEVRKQVLGEGGIKSTELEALVQYDEKGKKQKPDEKAIVKHLLGHYGKNILKDGNAIFYYYNKQHWIECQTRETDNIKRQVEFVGGGLDQKHVKSIYDKLLMHLPHVVRGRTMYQGNPFVSNFQNGTLHFETTGELSFKEHDHADFITHVLPFDFPGLDTTAECPEFEAWLQRLWANDPDRDCKIKLVYELVGAVLCPIYPVIVVLVGPPSSGKSTLIKLLVNLVDFSNTSQVQLSELGGFEMENMPGKLINFCTEMELKRPFRDAMVKQIIDRMPVEIRRKNKTRVQAYLPGVHLFGANALPKSLDGENHAYGRRMIVIRTDSLVLNERPEYDFEKRLLQRESAGIIARGIGGLKRLIENGGHYTRPESSKAEVMEMEMSGDTVGQFLTDMEAGHAQITTPNANGKDGFTIGTLVCGPDKTVKRAVLWRTFKEWHEDCYPRLPVLPRQALLDQLKNRGFRLHRTTKDGFVIRGIGFETGTNAAGDQGKDLPF